MSVRCVWCIFAEWSGAVAHNAGGFELVELPFHSRVAARGDSGLEFLYEGREAYLLEGCYIASVWVVGVSMVSRGYGIEYVEGRTKRSIHKSACSVAVPGLCIVCC